MGGRLKMRDLMLRSPWSVGDHWGGAKPPEAESFWSFGRQKEMTDLPYSVRFANFAVHAIADNDDALHSYCTQ